MATERSMSGSSDARFVCSLQSDYDNADEAEASALPRPIEYQTTWAQRDTAPLVALSESTVSNGSPYLRDLHILSLSFLLVFLAYGAMQNLESILHIDQGLGSTSLGILYFALTVSSVVAPIVVMWLGSKKALLLGLSGYWTFIAANFFPSWYTMIPASIFLGFTASVLWVAEGTYLTFIAKSHAAACDISEASALGSFNGEFWGVFSGNQVIGNLLSLALLQFGKKPVRPDESSSGVLELLIIFLGSMTIGTILACFLRPHTDEVSGMPSIDNDSVTSRGYLKASFALVSEEKMLLLICLLVYTGIQQAFIWGDFPKDIITPTLGLSWVGGVMAAFGASDTIGSFIAGKYSCGLFSITTIICGGACCQIVVIVWLYFKIIYGEKTIDYTSVFGAAVMWGLGDSAFVTQISALLGIFYPRDTEAAFAQWKIWQSAATSAAFFAGPYTNMRTKLSLLFFSLLISVQLFLVVIMRSVRGRRYCMTE